MQQMITSDLSGSNKVRTRTALATMISALFKGLDFSQSKESED